MHLFYGKTFSKKKKSNQKENVNEEKLVLYFPDRTFDDTPIPEPYNAPNNSRYLSIPEVKKASYLNGIPIWDSTCMIWQERFSDLGLLDDDFRKDFKVLEKIKIKDMNKKQCCELVTFYMRTNTFTKGIENGDIPRLAKRINDLTSKCNIF